MMDKEVKITNI